MASSEDLDELKAALEQRARIARTSDPQIDEETYFNMKDPMAQEFVKKIKAKDDSRRARLSPAGALGLSPLLDARRLEFLIPDAAFREQPVFDRILVFQVSLHEGETYGDTAIVMPAVTQDAEKHSNPRGILVSAGPIALDELRSNGVELGHVITFIKLAPFRLQVGTHGGKDDHLLLMRSCDVLASEDLAHDLRSGVVKLEEFVVEKEGRKFITHVFRDTRRDGVMHPQQPVIPEDM